MAFLTFDVQILQFASVFSSLVAVLSLAGNTLALIILVRFENLKLLTNSFLLNLAVSDVIFTLGLACMPLLISVEVNAELLWKITLFLFHTGLYSNTLLLIMMTVHRYLVMLHPLSDVQSQTGSYSITVSVVTWIVSFSASIPELQHPLQLVYRQSIFYFLLLCTATICHIRIFRKQSKTAEEVKDGTAQAVSFIVTFYILLWAPFSTLWILVNLMPISSVQKCLMWVVVSYYFFIALPQCFTKPVIYVFLGDTFRSHLRNLCCCKKRKEQSVTDYKETSFF